MKFKAAEERFLYENEVGTFATIAKSGFPHATPVSYVYHAGSVWMATDYDTAKYRNLQSNESCFSDLCRIRRESWNRNPGPRQNRRERT